MRGIWRRSSDRPKWMVETFVGLLMLPLSVIPLWLYMTRTDDGYLMYLRARYMIAAPSTPQLDRATQGLARTEATATSFGVPVLVYHGIGRQRDAEGIDGPYVVRRSRFAEHMRVLQTAGYQPVTTAQLARYVRTGDARELPAKPVLITFDDGRTDAMVQAGPIMRDTGMRAAMFVIGEIASRQSFAYEDWDALESAAGSGLWELQNHTFDLHDAYDDVKGRVPVSALVHPDDGESMSAFKQRIAADIDEEQAVLRRHSGATPIAFAYPFGDWGQHMPPAVQRVVDEVIRSRFLVAFDQDEQSGWRFALPGDDPIHIHRLRVPDWTGATLLRRLSQARALTETTYRDRGLDVTVGRDDLAPLAARGCPTPAQTPPPAAAVGSRKAIALAFSGGPSVYTPQIVDLLAEHHATATFFAIGDQINGRERQLRRLLSAGNEIGNGTWTARRGASVTLDETLTRTSAEIIRATGVRPCLTSPPGRRRVEAHAAAGRQHGLTTTLWSVDPRDFELSSPALIARRVLGAVEPGAIVLLHDGGVNRWATVQALDRILPALERKGYTVTTVSKLLAPTAELRAGADLAKTGSAR